jgi:hypothetical protein
MVLFISGVGLMVLRPLTGLLYQPRVIVKMIVEKQVDCRLTGETEVLGENLPQRHFVHSSVWLVATSCRTGTRILERTETFAFSTVSTDTDNELAKV